VKGEWVNWYNKWRRRVIAGLSLAAALVMSALGVTRVEPMLSGLSFLVWWGVVLMFVLTAISLAALDLMDLRHDLREERRTLAKTYLLDKQFLDRLQEKISKRREADDGKTAENKSSDAKPKP
jgi:hypothetical protein